MASVNDVARDLTELLRARESAEARRRFCSPGIASIEPMDLPGGMGVRASGKVAAKARCPARFGASRREAVGIDGRLVTGDRFAEKRHFHD